VMYELTTVSRLFKGENDYITMNRIVTGDIPSPTKKRPDYPPALEAIVMKALALDPADRYQTAGEMLEAIEQFATRERISLSTTALGRFIRELFGERPEPWQDLGAMDAREPSSDDVDIVEVTRSNVGGDTSITPAPVAGAAVSAVSNPSSVSYVPPPRRNWAWLGVALLAAAVAIGALIMAVSPASTRDGASGASATPGPASGSAPSGGVASGAPTPTPTPTPGIASGAPAPPAPPPAVDTPKPAPAAPIASAKPPEKAAPRRPPTGKKPVGDKPVGTTDKKPDAHVEPPHPNAGSDSVEDNPLLPNNRPAKPAPNPLAPNTDPKVN